MKVQEIEVTLHVIACEGKSIQANDAGAVICLEESKTELLPYLIYKNKIQMQQEL